MDMGIPFQIASKSVESNNHARFKIFLMVLIVEPVGKDLCGRLKQDMEKGTVLSEVRAEFFCNGKNNVSVFAMDEFKGNGVGAVSLIGSTAGVAESGVATERNKPVCTTVGALVKRASEIGVTTADDLPHFIINNRTDTGTD